MEGRSTQIGMQRLVYRNHKTQHCIEARIVYGDRAPIPRQASSAFLTGHDWAQGEGMNARKT